MAYDAAISKVMCTQTIHRYTLIRKEAVVFIRQWIEGGTSSKRVASRHSLTVLELSLAYKHTIGANECSTISVDAAVQVHVAACKRMREMHSVKINTRLRTWEGATDSTLVKTTVKKL